MKQNRPVPRWLVLAFGLAITVVLAGGAWFYNAQEQSLQRRIETELQTVGQFKVDQIVAWRAERLGDANVLMDNAFFTDAIARWLDAPQAKDTELIRSQFRSLQEHHHYADGKLVDASGQIRLSLDGASGPIHPEAASTLAQVLRDRRPALTDLHLSPGDQSPHLDVIAPLFAQNGAASEPVGAVILEVAARQFLYPLIQSWPTPSRTAETLLVRRDGDAVLFLNDLRYQKGAALTRRIPLSQVEVPAVMAVLGKEGVVQGKDYRGVAVLAALKAVPDSPWFMVSKMDTDEAFADWRNQSIFILALILVFVAATTAGAGMVWQGDARAHYQSLAQAQASLRESEEKYRNLFENAQVGMYRSQLDGTAFLDVNNKFAEIMGFSRQELLGMPGRIRWARQEDRDQMLTRLKEQGGSLVDYDVQILTKNGAMRDLSASIKLYPEEGYLEGSMLDITDRKRAEAALALNAVRLEALLELHKRMDAPQPQLLDFVLDASLKTAQSQLAFIGLLDDAEAVMTIHAFSQDALAQCAFDDKPRQFLIAEAGIWAECVWRRAPFMLNRYDDPHPSKKGVPAGHVPITRFLAVPVFDGDRIVAVAAVANKPEDYTKSDSQALTALLDRTWGIIRRKQVEEAFREERDKLAKLATTVPGMLCSLRQRPDGSVHMPYASPASQDVIGFQPEDLAQDASLMLALVHPDDVGHNNELIAESARSLSPWRNEFRYQHPQKGEIWLEGYSMPQREADGSTIWHGFITDITARKRVEMSLQKSEEQFRGLAQTLPDTVYILDLVTRQMTFINKDAFLGYSREELIASSSILNALHPDDASEAMAQWEQVIRGEKTKPVEYRLRNKSGNWEWVQSQSAVLSYTADGAVAELIYVLAIVTERKRAEEALHESEERFRRLFNGGNDTIFVFGLTENSAPTPFIEVNDVACARLGYTRAELLNMTPAAINAPESAANFPAALKQLVENKSVILTATHLAKDGRRIPVEINAQIFELGGKPMVLAIARDITERKQAEDSLRASEERLHLATRAGTIGIWDWDIANNILVWDDSMFSLYGIRKEDFGGAYDAWSRTLHPDDRQFTEGEIQAALSGEREYAPEFGIVRPDGVVRIIKAASQTFRDQNGKALRMIGTNTDITERRQAEAQVFNLNAELEQRASQLEAARDEAERANRAKSEFLSRMSHELRTPLNAILGFAQLLEMDELAPMHAKGVGYILKAGRHLLDMINEVLDLARIESGRLALSLKPVQLRSLILETLDLVRLMADARRLTLELADAPANDLFVRADRQRLKQVLLNLINNAIKYNREGGSVIVDCRPVLSTSTSLSVDSAEGLQNVDLGSTAAIRNPQSAICAFPSPTPGPAFRRKTWHGSSAPSSASAPNRPTPKAPAWGWQSPKN